jgi:hypothetical protein
MTCRQFYRPLYKYCATTSRIDPQFDSNAAALALGSAEFRRKATGTTLARVSVALNTSTGENRHAIE